MDFIFGHLGDINLDVTSSAKLIYEKTTRKHIDKFKELILEHKKDKKIMSKALAFAIVEGNCHAAQKLIEVGADVNQTIRSTNNDVFYLMRSSIRYTPLLLAIDYGYRRVVKLLLENGANPNGKGKDFGGSDLLPLIAALSFGNINIVRDLIEYGADVNCVHNVESGEPVLHRIIKYYMTIDIIGLVMRNYKTNINTVSSTKQSLLQYAIRILSPNTARYFLNLGIDVNLENSNGETALDYAGRYLHALENSIIRRIIKLKAANCFVSKKNLSAVNWESSEVKSFYEKCSRQVEIMKKTDIGNSNLTLYKVLHKCDYELTLALIHVEKKVVVNLNYAGVYLYEKNLDWRLRRAVERKKVLVEVENVVFDIFYGVLPHTFVRKLFYCLTTAELEILLIKK